MNSMSESSTDLGCRKGDWFQTYTGKKFWPLDPRLEDFDIVDIAHALANICRFGGHCTEFYSVAQHCCHVSDVLRRTTQHAYAGLLHDATEAYLGDMVRPLKYSMPEYLEAEQVLEHMLSLKFGVPMPLPYQVKEADNLLLVTERRDLLVNCGHRWHPSLEAIEPLRELHISPWTPEQAEARFLSRFYALQ